MFSEYIIDMHLSFKILVVLFVSQRFIFYFYQDFVHSVQIQPFQYFCCLSDLDECKLPKSFHHCRHTYVNTPGSYYCKCNKGFILSANGRICRSKGPLLIYLLRQGGKSVKDFGVQKILGEISWFTGEMEGNQSSPKVCKGGTIENLPPINCQRGRGQKSVTEHRGWGDR